MQNYTRRRVSRAGLNRARLLLFLFMACAMVPGVARAQGPITNGFTHAGVIPVGGLDTWTFQATLGDSITLRIGEVPATGTDPQFVPRIRLQGPDNAVLGDTQPVSAGSTNAGEIDARAPLTGTPRGSRHVCREEERLTRA